MDTLKTAQGEDKEFLREKFKDLRRKFKSQGVRSIRSQLSQNLQKFITDFNQPDLQVCLYRARRDEAPCAVPNPTRYFFPLMEGDNLEFRRPLFKDAFQTNKLAIEEPIRERSQAIDLKKPMIVFCPAVAVDDQGVRLGLGKGYYDRFFSLHPEALRVGLIYHVQFTTHPLPADSWDQAMDWIITEKMILRVANSRSS